MATRISEITQQPNQRYVSRRIVSALSTLAVFGTLGISGTSAENSILPIGDFATGVDGPIIAIAVCGEGKLCGRIVGLGKLPATDLRNPKAAQKTRNLCGLTVLTVAETRYMRPGAYWEGQYYQAEKGTSYNVLMSAVDSAHLSVGGTSGDPMMTRIFPFLVDWRRAPVGFVACSMPVS